MAKFHISTMLFMLANHIRKIQIIGHIFTSDDQFLKSGLFYKSNLPALPHSSLSSLIKNYQYLHWEKSFLQLM